VYFFDTGTRNRLYGKKIVAQATPVCIGTIAGSMKVLKNGTGFPFPIIPVYKQIKKES